MSSAVIELSRISIIRETNKKKLELTNMGKTVAKKLVDRTGYMHMADFFFAPYVTNPQLEVCL